MTGQMHGFRILNIIKEKLCAAWWAGRGGVSINRTSGSWFSGCVTGPDGRVPDIRGVSLDGTVVFRIFQFRTGVLCMSMDRTDGFRDILQVC